MAPNKDQAKRVILEIIRQAGGEIGKTKLFKAFWLAHLFYSKKAPGYLSDWPIVRMPKGPGIDRADSLLNELIATGNVRRTHQPKGPFTEINCSLTEKPIDTDLPQSAVLAVKEAVEYVCSHTAESISDLSHEFSRSWNNTPDGEELNIYSDLIPDDVYEERRRELMDMNKAYEEFL